MIAVELNNGHPEDRLFWFGGGGDLTPALLYDEDAKHFHSTIQHACETAGGSNAQQYYPKFKVRLAHSLPLRRGCRS